MIRVFLFAAALIALQATPAHADPVSAVAAFFIKAGVGAFAAVTLAHLTLSLGFTLLSQAIQKKLQRRPEVSVQFDIAVGDDTPLNFVVGDYATAGKRKYIGSWGPNTRYITEVIEVSCLPQPGQPAVWVNDELGDVIWSETETYSDRVLSGYEEVLVQVGGSEGYQELQRRPVYSPRSFVLGHPLSNYQNSGRKIWIKWVDGSQTEADPLLLAVFADDPDYPWTAAMVGTGKSYAIITTLYDSKTLTSYPSYLIQPPPLPMYDPRLDSTAGGIGPQRWGNRATYAPSRNPAVIAYNLCRGVYFGSEWIYGGRNLDAWRLPFAEWVAAMNACDDPVDLDGGGTEPAYRCGVEIKADMEPLSVIEEIGRAANMRFAEVGGMIKPVVGLPGASVFTISDDDIIITEGQSFRPFAPVLETFNALSATYPEPAEKWASKDAPEYIDNEATAEDGGRYLPTSTTFAACPYAHQVQRLMRAQLRDYRRMRIHQFHLPPDAYKLEPIVDTITWNSARNGYVGKQFVIESIAKLPGMNVSVSLREVVPGDQDWSSAFEKPVQITPPVIVPPWILDVRDFAVIPATVTDATDQARRPGIRVSVAGGEIGVTEVRIRIRKAGGTDPEFEISRAYAEPWAWVITEGILPDTAYEVSVALISEIGDLSWWSEWESVTAPDVRLSMADLADSVSNEIADVAELAGVKPVTSLPAAGDKPDQIVMLVPDGLLYRWDAVAEDWTRSLFAGIKPGDVDVASFAAGIEPVTVHTGGSLPTVKGTEALTWNGKLYRWNGTAYVASVPAVDVTGTLTDAQLADLNAAKLTGTLSPDRIGTGALLSAKLADNAVTVAKIADAAITAGKIASGAVSLTKFASGIEPVTVHTGGSLPTVKGTEALTWNGKLYRWNGAAYVASVPAVDVTGTLTDAQLADLNAAKLTGTLSPDRIGTGALLSAKLADNAVTVAKIADAAITAGKIASGAVSLTKFASGIEPVTVHTGGSLPTVKGTEALTWNGKLYRWNGTAYVASVPAVDVTGTLTDAQLADLNAAKLTGTLSPDRIGTGALLSAKLADNAVTTAKIASAAVNAARLATGSVTTAKVAAGAITAAEIGAGAITTAKLAAGAVTANEIAAGTITATQIASSAITTVKLDAAAVTTAKVAAGAITAGEIASNAVTAVKINAGAVETTKLAAGAVTADKVAANAITAGKIAAGAVSADQISAQAITASKLLLSDTSNIVLNPIFADGTMDGLDVSAGGSPVVLPRTDAAVPAGAPTVNVLRLNVATSFVRAGPPVGYTTLFPVKPGESYWLEMDCASTADANADIELRLQLVGAELDGLQWVSVSVSRVAPSVTWGRISGMFTVPATITGGVVPAFGGFLALINTAGTPAGSWFITNLTSRRAANADLIVDGAVSAVKVSAGAITAEKIGAGAVTTAKLAAGAVTANEIAAGTITATQIASSAITTVKLDAAAVTTAKVAAGAITASEIASNAVTAVKITAGAVEAAKIATNAVTADKVAANAITAGKIAAGVISATELGANAVTAIKLAAGAVEAAKIAAGAVEAVAIGAGAVTTAKLAAGAVTANEIAAGTITATQIASSAITTVKLDAAAVTTAKVAAGAITAGEIASNAVTAVKISAGAVEAAKIAAGAVTADKVAANAITAGKIAAGAVSADQISAQAITASKLLLSDTSNIVLNPIFADGTMDGLDVSAGGSPVVLPRTDAAVPAGAPTVNVLRLNVATGFVRAGPPVGYTTLFPVKPGESYRLEMDCAATADANAPINIRLQLVSETLGGLQWFSANVFRSATGAGSWARIGGTFTVPATIAGGAVPAFAGFLALVNTAGTPAGSWFITNLTARRAANADLIVDGAVSAAKIAAGSITADKVAAGAIVTSKIAAGAITADKFAAGQIIAGDLVVTGSITRLQLESGTLSDRVVISQSPAFFSGTGGTYAPVRDAPGNGPFDNTNSTLVDTISVVLSATDNNVPERIFLEFSTVNYIAFNWTTPGTGNTYQSWYVVVNVKVNGTTIDTVEVPLKVGGWNWASLTEFVHIRGADVSQSIQLLKGVDFDPGDTLSFEFRAWRYRQASNETLTLDISETRATLTEFYR